MPGSERFVEMT